MRRIWLVGTAMAALIAVPAIDMQAHAASFDSTQATANGTTMNIAPDDSFVVACGCGGGGGEGGGGGAEGSDGRDGTGGADADGGGTGSGAEEEEDGQQEY